MPSNHKKPLKKAKKVTLEVARIKCHSLILRIDPGHEIGLRCTKPFINHINLIYNILAANKQVTGYAFLIYMNEVSVQHLISKCYREGDRYYILISSKTVSEKPVQVRPWHLSDIDHMPRPSSFLDPRRTVSFSQY